MKILALVGTNADFSYNRILLRYMKKHFRQMADIEIAEISQLPPFSVDTPLSEQTEVWKLKQKLRLQTELFSQLLNMTMGFQRP